MEHRSHKADFIVSADGENFGNQRPKQSTPNVAHIELLKEKQVGGAVNCSDLELCTYLLALGEGYLPTFYSDTNQSARLSGMNIASKSYQQGKKTVCFHGFQSLEMSSNLTVDRGVAELMWYLEAFLAKHTVPLLPGKTTQMIFGLKCVESWQMSLPGSYLPRTSAKKQLTQQQTTLSRWVTKPDAFNCQRKTWVQTTFGKEVGYLHTPTTQGNYCAPSMQKHQSCRNYKMVFGQVTPESQEYLMGWPIGWTELKPLETDRFQLWLQQHGKS